MLTWRLNTVPEIGDSTSKYTCGSPLASMAVICSSVKSQSFNLPFAAVYNEGRVSLKDIASNNSRCAVTRAGE